MINDLKKALFEAVLDTINKNSSSLAVAFSGGIDSSLLAKICKDIGIKVTLLTIGFPLSQDIEFSKQIALKLDLPHKISVLMPEQFQKDVLYIQQKIACRNISHIENCIAYFYIARMANQNNLQLILTANGCDELFCGYNKFRLIYDEGIKRIIDLMDERIANERLLLNEIDKITTEFGVLTKQPFFSQKFIDLAKDIPIEQKITGSNDFIRKHILRKLALSIGIPRESAMKPKKALQYGSLIHRNFKRTNK
ncbi:MAG TPA: asparagine synthase C-terminal domain-containing protein [Nitrososphaeraceae archaeon]|nr:asparagine synthase C-terminal domain-containing protein [Nitrososphaeraceae archaeon]